MVNALRLLKMPLFIGFLKNKIYSDDDVLEEELLKYIGLNKKRFLIKKFKNKLRALKEILK